MNEALPVPQQPDPAPSADPAGSAVSDDPRAAVRPDPGDATPVRPARVTPLAAALRRARAENAEHSAAVAEVRSVEIARLELLGEALEPILAQVPEECDIFDVAVSPGARPRLFIDHIGFVEMEPDRRTYRFLQDTRHGRVLLKSGSDIDTLVDAITDYIAHRLIEREKALAIDYASGGAARTMRVAARPAQNGAGAEGDSRLWRAYLFGVEALGALAFFSLLAAIAYWALATPPAG
jgi:hypothetical protein